MVDFLIVGSGLAGIAFTETALAAGKSVHVFSNGSHNSTTVAAGLYNAVILKRFSGLQHAQQHLDIMNGFYDTIEAKLGQKFRVPIPLLRRFASIEEQNNWFEACDKPLLSSFLSPVVRAIEFEGMNSTYGYGEVLQTGYVKTDLLQQEYRKFLDQEKILSNEAFEYDQLKIEDDLLMYNGYTARHIVFAEGYGLHSNPYFNNLPLDGTKGEMLLIKAAGLKLDVSINAGIFILPIGNSLYKVGATYNWDDKTQAITQEGRNELLEKLHEVLSCEFEIVDHLAGVRPTTRDRKALIGTHPHYKRLHILNGLGTRGVMLAPAMAQALFAYIETRTPLPREVDVARFYNSWPRQACS